MPTDLITYCKLGDPLLLEQRFQNIELCIKKFKLQFDYLQRVSVDPEFAKQELKKWQDKIDDCKVDMQNIIEAIEIINDDSEDDEEQDDEEDENEEQTIFVQ